MDESGHPVAGVDYPQTFQALDEWFRDDETCRAYIRRLRWPNGFVCPHCGATEEPWTMAGGWLRCRACRRETSLTSGTIFEGTRKPLRTWFLAMWFVTSQKNGVSALGLQRELGFGSYETAWTWLHKLANYGDAISIVEIPRPVPQLYSDYIATCDKRRKHLTGKPVPNPPA